MSGANSYLLDLLAVKRSLAALQERCDDLHDKAEARFVALAAERDVQVKEKEEAQLALEECRKQLDEKESQLAKWKEEAQGASEETELLLLQLNQVQEELEYYFLISRRLTGMLRSSENLFKKTFAIISETAL